MKAVQYLSDTRGGRSTRAGRWHAEEDERSWVHAPDRLVRRTIMMVAAICALFSRQLFELAASAPSLICAWTLQTSRCKHGRGFRLHTGAERQQLRPRGPARAPFRCGERRDDPALGLGLKLAESRLGGRGSRRPCPGAGRRARARLPLAAHWHADPLRSSSWALPGELTTGNSSVDARAPPGAHCRRSAGSTVGILASTANLTGNFSACLSGAWCH
jgi:hypothetical protein